MMLEVTLGGCEGHWRGCVVHMDALVMTCVMSELLFGAEERLEGILCQFDLEGCALDPLDPPTGAVFMG